MTSKQSTSSEEATVGRWTLNMFLMFLTGGQTLLLPWLPLVLRGVGMPPVGIGATLGTAGVVSTLSGYLFLRAIRRTRNGGIRRILLLFLVLISSTFFFTSALVASPPSAAFSRSCRLEYPPAAGSIPQPGQFDEFLAGLLPSSSQNVSSSSAVNASPSSPQLTEAPGRTDDEGTANRKPNNETLWLAIQKSSTTTKSTVNPNGPLLTPENDISQTKDESSSSKSNSPSPESVPFPNSKDSSVQSNLSLTDSMPSLTSKESSFEGNSSSTKSMPSPTSKDKSSSSERNLTSPESMPSPNSKDESLSLESNSPSTKSKPSTSGTINLSFSPSGTSSSHDVASGVQKHKSTKKHPNRKSKTKGGKTKAKVKETTLPRISSDFYFDLEPDDNDNGDDANAKKVIGFMPSVSKFNKVAQEVEAVPSLPVSNEGLPQRSWDLKQLRENYKEHIMSFDSRPDSPALNMHAESPHVPVPDNKHKTIPDDMYRKMPGMHRKIPDDTYRKILENTYGKIPDSMNRNIPDETYRKIPNTKYRKMQGAYESREDRFPVDYDALFRSFPGLRGAESGAKYSPGKVEANDMGTLGNAIAGPVPELDHKVQDPLFPPPQRLSPPSGLYHGSNSKSHKVHRRKRSAGVSSSSTESVIVETNTTDLNSNVEDPLEDSAKATTPTMLSTGHMYATAVLVVLAYAFGACVEYLVLKLRHCYTHGYDEVSRESLDIVETTITYTFDFSMYGTHRSWSNLTSAAMVLMAAAMLSFACSLQISLAPPLVSLATMYFCLMGLSLLSLMCVTIPYGSIDAPRTKRALSLYLDNEVLREGIRRLSFHCYVGVCGFTTSLLFNFSLLLIEDLSTSPEAALMAQALTVAMWLMGEGLTIPASKWFISRLGILEIMGVSLWMVSFLLVMLWGTSSPWVMTPAHAILGFVKALTWIAIKHNSLLLATISDQEGEVTASWWVWRLSSGIGVAAWGAAIGHAGLISHMFIPAAAITAIGASVIISVAIGTRSERRSKRRVYHTLDLSDESEEDEDFLGKPEEDWLVKRASKEGITL